MGKSGNFQACHFFHQPRKAYGGGKFMVAQYREHVHPPHARGAVRFRCRLAFLRFCAMLYFIKNGRLCSLEWRRQCDLCDVQPRKAYGGGKFMVAQYREHVHPPHHILQYFNAVRPPVDYVPQHIERILRRKINPPEHFLVLIKTAMCDDTFRPGAFCAGKGIECV